MAKILFAGCGYIGSQLGMQLAAVGHQCFGLRRQCNQLPEAIQPLCGDVTQPETLTTLPANLDYVVVTLTPGGFDEASYQRAYVQGLKNLVAALKSQGQTLQRLIFVSSSAVYHQNAGEWVDEQSVAEPRGFSGKAMLEAEKVAAASDYPSTCVRFSGIYGRGRQRLVDWALEGVTCAETPPHYSNRIHQQDCVGVLRHLLELDMRGGPVETLYLASDPNPAGFGEILNWIRQQLDSDQADPQQGIEKRLRAGSKRCNSQRLQASGYQFKYPDYQVGFTELLGQIKQQD
ncbi:MAG: NAD(P)H-binding protein [Motiliproteus sp.]